MCISQEVYIQHPICITNLLYKTLKEPRKMGYQINKYHWFVMNKIVKGKHFIILWNYDDLNMLHVDSGIESSVISDIDA